MNIIEIWKDVVGYEGLYEVSNLGNIKSLKRLNERGFLMKERLIYGAKNPEGYWRLRLWKNKKSISASIHRIVAITFLPNPENKPRVNHIDNNPSNNKLSNLEWATHQEDIDHKCRQNRQNRPIGEKSSFFGKKGPLSPFYGKRGELSHSFGGKSPFARLVLDTQTGIYYDCVKDAAYAKGLNAGTLYNRLCGNRKNNTSLILA